MHETRIIINGKIFDVEHVNIWPCKNDEQEGLIIEIFEIRCDGIDVYDSVSDVLEKKILKKLIKIAKNNERLEQWITQAFA